MRAFNRRWVLVAVGAVAACLPARGDDPADIVRRLYDRYLQDTAEMPSAQDMAPWSDGLRAKMASLDETIDGQPPALTFDPIVHAQDWRLSDVVATSEDVVAGRTAVVRVRFNNFGRADEVVYDLVWQGDAWRVDNIRGADWDLREIIATAP